MAAELMGFSRRTLQRHLKAANLTYSQLLDRARYETATRMLSHPAVKVIDVAYHCGYEDPSHFIRAFRRIAGTSPGQYKRLATEIVV